MQKTLIFTAMFFFGCTLCFAQENVIYLKDGQVMAEGTQGAELINYMKDKKYSKYKLKKWKVKEQSDPIQPDEKVSAKKSALLYSKKAWIANKKGTAQNVVIDYKANRAKEKLVFSPNEKIVFYKALSENAEDNIVYGYNFMNKNVFSLGKGDDINILTCPDKTDFVVLTKDSLRQNYYVYSLNGTQTNVFIGVPGREDIKRELCY